MSRLDDLITRHPVPSMRPLAWVVMILLAALIFWASGAQRDEVSSAEGEIVPIGQIKVIQHLEGGIIELIHVANGSTVEEGDPLVRLNLAAAGVNREELRVTLDGLILKQARLEAEARGKTLSFPDEVASRRRAFTRSELAAYQGRKAQLARAISVHRQLLRQRGLEIKEYEAKCPSVRHQNKWDC